AGPPGRAAPSACLARPARPRRPPPAARGFGTPRTGFTASEARTEAAEAWTVNPVVASLLAPAAHSRGMAGSSTTGGGNQMNRTVVTTALAAVLALVAMAAVVGSARATYPGATNGRIAFGIRINGNTDVYS